MSGSNLLLTPNIACIWGVGFDIDRSFTVTWVSRIHGKQEWDGNGKQEWELSTENA